MGPNAVVKREEDRYNALRYVLNDRRGRQFVQMLTEECGLYGHTWHGDKDAMLVSEGRREIALWIREMVRYHGRENEAQILTEATERENYYDTLDLGGMEDG